MNIYLVTRTDKWSYDDYDAIVVIAKTPEIAIRISPSGKLLPIQEEGNEEWGGPWVISTKSLKVKLIGTAIKGSEQGVVLNSFNAG